MSLFFLHGKENLIIGQKPNKISPDILNHLIVLQFLILSFFPRFDFKTSCFICGEACNIKKDVRHPEPWYSMQDAFYADRVFSKDGLRRKSSKEVLLQAR